GQVPALAHVAQVGRVERLHADQYAAAAALDHQLQQLIVLGDVDARLADPADLQRDQLAAQLADPGGLADDVVVHDEEAAAAGRLHLGGHLAGRAVVLARAVESSDRAEVALEVAAPGELDQGDVLIVLAVEQLASGPQPAQRASAEAVVDRPQAAVPGVVEQ